MAKIRCQASVWLRRTKHQYGGGSLSEPRGVAGLTQTSTFENEVED